MNEHVFLQGKKLDFGRRTQHCCSKTRFARFGSGAKSVCTNDEQSMEIHSRIYEKTMKNLGKIHARKSDAKNIENHQQSIGFACVFEISSFS